MTDDSTLPWRGRKPPPITSADQVLNIREPQSLARDALQTAHFDYIATGLDDNLIVARNRT